jgi:hypothetical protein
VFQVTGAVLLLPILVLLPEVVTAEQTQMDNFKLFNIVVTVQLAKVLPVALSAEVVAVVLEAPLLAAKAEVVAVLALGMLGLLLAAKAVAAC